MSMKVSAPTLVTPEMAEEWLNANKDNRDLVPGRAEMYAADMAAGRWTECVDPIVWDEDGRIANGQHRLFAIVFSGCAQSFILVRGIRRGSRLNIDTGKVRGVVDNAKISGDDPGLSNQLISYARGIEDGDSGSVLKHPRSHAEVLGVVARHRDAATWVMNHGPMGRGIRNAPVMAAIGRAFYHETDHSRLEKFSEVLGKGVCEHHSDNAAIALRTFLTSRLASRISVVSGANWRDTFLRAQNAIRYFMRGKSIASARRVTDEAYPLAKSKKAATTQRGKRAAAKAERRVSA